MLSGSMSFSSVEKFPRMVRVIDAVTFHTVKQGD